MECFFCGKEAWYRCPRSGRFVCHLHARFEIVAGEEKGQGKVDIREARTDDYARIEELALHFWGETEVECFDGHYEVLRLPALVVESEGEVVGFLSYAEEGDRMVLVMLNLLPPYQGRGWGKALLEAARREGLRKGLARMVVATTNDDLPALYLYQRCGFALKEFLPGKVAQHHGEEIPGFAGIPVRDELRLEVGIK